MTKFSANPQQSLPAGWSCDQEKNKYDLGLWNSGVTTDFDDVASEVVQQEVLARFLRVAPGPLQTQRFMASITIRGKIYTTNSVEGIGTPISWIAVSPVRPYVLGVSELTRHLERRAYYDSDAGVYVRVYYWMPPIGLSFFDNLGLSNPTPIINEGEHFNTAVFSHEFGRVKIGVVVGRDGVGQLIYMRDVQRGVYANKNPLIEFNKRSTIMRAIEFVGPVPGEAASVFSYWTLRDNFGCEHRYRLSFLPLVGSLELTG